MEALIEEIVRKLHHLPEVKILEVLDFVEFLTWNKERSISQQVESDVTSQEDQEFEAIANQVIASTPDTNDEVADKKQISSSISYGIAIYTRNPKSDVETGW